MTQFCSNMEQGSGFGVRSCVCVHARVRVWIVKSRELEKTSQELPMIWSWPQKSHEINENMPFLQKASFCVEVALCCVNQLGSFILCV